ncbi:hypothetical protein ACFLX9_04100, partial [Chloroflexota bacterium]
MKQRLAAPILSWFLPLWHLLATLLFLLLVVPTAWLAGWAGLRKRRSEPRIVFGATPMINSKYHSRALRKVGLDSTTVVRGYHLSINTRQDFDIIFGIVDPSWSRWRRWYTRLLDVYVQFAKLLWQRDVFFYYFDGFYLRRGGPLRWLEVPALKLLGKRVVAMPYGADMVTAADIPDVIRKYANARQYPSIATNEALIHRQIHHFTRWADAIVGGLAIGPDSLPRIDYLCPTFFAIDEGEWIPTYGPLRIVGDTLRVLHTPNHRIYKGTQFLIDAVEQLRGEGLNVELVLLERVPNAEVRRIMAGCHVLAEQFMSGWYALSGQEGMASGKPVMCYIRPDLKRLFSLFSFGGECPVV